VVIGSVMTRKWPLNKLTNIALAFFVSYIKADFSLGDFTSQD